LSPKELAILQFVAANPDMPRWKIAEHFDISGSRLSVLTCCRLGKAYLEKLQSAW
jgi:hypothetical protein